ncbi:unnamed protein product [Victoria cruziana]
MANALHRFLKKPQVLGLINATKLISPFLRHTSLTENAVPAASIVGNRTTQVVNPKRDAADLFPSHIFPAFQLGVQLDPLPSSGSEEFLEDGESDDVEERVILADSVKKKRKKKMNKHKYKKLRKRLRRKTGGGGLRSFSIGSTVVDHQKDKLCARMIHEHVGVLNGSSWYTRHDECYASPEDGALENLNG